MAKKNKRTLAKRQRDIADNQLLSKILAQELPEDVNAPNSQIWVLKREVRGDGVILRPIRISFEQAAEVLVNFYDEGNSGTQYLPDAYYDEGSSDTVYTSEQILDEGGV